MSTTRNATKNNGLLKHLGERFPEPWQCRGLLTAAYVDCGYSPAQIADAWECDPRTIRKWIEKYELREARRC